MASTSVGNSRIGQEASGSVQSRAEILKTSGKAIGDAMPFGSGLGSFRQVYRLYESPDRVGPEYVIHAHNDYAEVTLELVLAGVFLIPAFIIWWAIATKAAWRGWTTGTPHAKASITYRPKDSP